MTFTVTELLNGGYLVEGTDGKGTDGSTILHSERWSAAKYMLAHKEANAVWEGAVREFFKPLTDAADQAKATFNEVPDRWGRVVVTEETEAVAEDSVELDGDGILLRILDEGEFDLLRWVNGGTQLVAILK